MTSSTSSVRDKDLASPTTNRLSKRAHLIKEICTTERAYAKDLALVRDAYLYRLRPSSLHSSVSTTRTNGQLSPGSRTSTFTVDTAATSQTSFFMDPSGKTPPPLPTPPSDKVPPNFMVSSRPPSIYGATSLVPNSSINSTQSSPSWTTRARSSSKSGSPPSALDIKAIFLNLEQLAAFADELATAFEQAAGDGSGREPVTVGQDAEETDSLGAVFLDAVPKMTALFTVYCAKQSQANDRLHEIQKNPLYSAFFQDCWNAVQPFTNAWDLGSMLIKPVQRVLKYPLLFGDLLSNTSPVHPDYFNLRKAATSAREVGDEINEVKRRKDVVDRALQGKNVRSNIVPDSGSKKSSGPNLSFGFGKKIRGKIKERVNSSATPSPPSVNRTISAASEAQLRGLVLRMTDADKVVRRVGQEINSLPNAIQGIWTSQYRLVETWVQVAAIQPGETADAASERMEMYRLLVAEVLSEPVQHLESQIHGSIVPAFSTLLQLGINPRALIGRLQSKEVDYHKFQLAIRKKSDEKALDPQIRASAMEYIALHTQLLEELPSYLVGYGKILDLTLLHLCRAQSNFYQSVRARHRAFILAVSGEEPPSDEDGEFDVLKADVEVMDGRAMVKNWHTAWKPFDEIMEGLAIAQGECMFDIEVSCNPPSGVMFLTHLLSIDHVI